ncbi:cytochrome c oxidase subunit II (mitochondrion) [Thrips palmi]|uniref:Cytochrome c oxidase subunit 2 n=2 Tax=Thrips palmi TaxID=161013 RepID=A0A386T9Y4_THRPL|nr:cytochrome c oxidase subunit II [Thrips palmi]AYE84564.1 cytochrome c oxidase subunit II [Thrips palmi]UKT59912.1 cytochrome c oxidase subunit II [Thrips palmi]UKT59925.1 cytochrome c oxidase subunit II [Thrips palmi]UKT59938.1 cytochrome c oxidase subunit II [Thrips palmi]
MHYYNIFLNSSSITISVMEEFHDYTNLFLSMIITFILMIIVKLTMSKFTNYNFKENTNLEIIWTILPMLILCLIAYPSLYYLYLFDLNMNPTISVKVFGAQWYWIYENFDSISGNSYSSYMVPDNELLKDNLSNLGWRLLMTDTRLIVPFGTEVQCLTTSLDVIHSFSIPELGIKVDAIPGRLNSVNFKVTKPGLYYGQCAEICGTGHSFMPICMEAI